MVFSKEISEKYLDKEGLDYLIEQLDKRYSTTGEGGTVEIDLTNYYNKEEVDNLVANAGDGEDGIGIQSVQLVDYELIVTLTDGTQTNLGNIRGEQGEKGADGTMTFADLTDEQKESLKGADGVDGTNGVSPTITVTEIDGGHQLSITDVNGTQTVNILDGEDGTGGVAEEHTHTMSDITDLTVAKSNTYSGGQYDELVTYGLLTSLTEDLNEYVETEKANIEHTHTMADITDLSIDGTVDLSNYYTKEEVYTKKEVDKAIANVEVNGGSSSGSDSGCDLYNTVVANGGAIKEFADKSYVADDGSKVSEVIQDIIDNGTVESGTVLFYGNPNKTTADLYNDLKDVHTPTQYVILASTTDMDNFDITQYSYNTSTTKEYTSTLVGRCLFTEITEDRTGIIYLGELRVDIRHYNGAYRRLVLHKEFYYTGSNSGVGKTLWAVSTADASCTYTTTNILGQEVNDAKSTFGKLKYFTNKIYDSTTFGFVDTVSQEFTNNILDNYLCANTVTIQVPVNYTLAEWGEKLDNSVGEDGKDGVSPTITVTETDNGHTVAITDTNGTQTFEVTNGTDGKDGTTPDLSNYYNKEETYSKTEVDELVANSGSSDSGSSSSGGSSGITYAYETEIATGDTWIDGKPIYMKVFHVDGLETSPSDAIVYGTYCSQTPFAETIVSAEPVWKSNSNNQTFNGNVMQYFTPVSGSSGSSAISAINNLLRKTAWIQVWQSSSTFGITVTRGLEMYDFGCDVYVRYTKA